ncbi:MFS transporter [Novosphingobium sp. PY1]|uniref:MFS transporter n=1 Tax=Novosphingobium sp. PY1 TaxID=1882221 RepID=UPI000BE77692|nr:MFS transporter [Novosphingobium sp. PY1]BBA74024.1 nucleoside:H symporter [Novosphingobium sp. PY1]GFM31261.1 nucleoside:H symporter [Novosphingobium sp. PY1]
MNTKLKLFIMMAMQLAVWGAWAPKIFPYMTGLGFTPGQQALVGSSWGIAAFAGLFFSNQFADRNFAAERFMAFNHALSGLCLLGVAWSASFATFFGFFLVYSLIYVPTLSVSNALAFANLAQPARDFGKVRTGGTLGWVLVSWPFFFLLGAHATLEQIRWIFLVAAIISFVLTAFSLTLPHTPPRKHQGVDSLAWRSAFLLLRQPFVAVLFVVTFIDSVIHNGYFVMADAFLTDRVGIAGNLSMIVLSLGQIAELLTMFVLGRVVARLGWRTTLIIGVLGHAVRFAVFAFAPDSVPVIMIAQLLHGICYAFFFAVVYIFFDDVFPEDLRTSAQGLVNLLVLGIGMVVASFLFPLLMTKITQTVAGPAGPISVVDYRTLFMVPVGLSLLSALILAFGFRPPSRGPALLPIGH